MSFLNFGQFYGKQAWVHDCPHRDNKRTLVQPGERCPFCFRYSVFEDGIAMISGPHEYTSEENKNV